MAKSYVPSTFQIQCKCGRVITIRTKEQVHTEPCWNCNRTIKVVMGYGVNNFRCYIVEETRKEESVYPIQVDQGGKA